MRPIWKRVKTLAPHCPKCGEQLQGENSIMLPWKCSCGEWQPVLFPFDGNYKIKEKIE